MPDSDTGSGDYLTSTHEPQVPTGKYTTAIEVRPILETSKNSWVGVVEYEGEDSGVFPAIYHLSLGAVDSNHIEIVFDDGSTDFAEFNRNEILFQLGR